MTNLIPLFVVLPLAGAFFISIIAKKIKWLPCAVGVAATLMLLILSFAALRAVSIHGTLVYSVGAWKPPIGIAMVLDGLTAFVLITANLIGFLTALYSVDYMKRYTSRWKFYALFLLMIGGMNGVLVTGDIFNLFVFLEISSIAGYSLVAFGTERNQFEAALKYAVMGAMGSLFLLLGIVLLYGYTSTLNMADIALVLTQNGKSNIILMISVLFIVGFGLKSAMVPFHAWLPDAYLASPSPVSAAFSGAAVKSLGIYAMFRVFYNVIGTSEILSSILMFLGVLSMIVGVFLAIGQWDFRRLLAYHSISQIGYIVLGIGLGTPLGILGGLFHLFNHSMFKPLLFLNSGAVEYSTGVQDLRNMGGLAKKMPVTRITGLIASLSISGVPPFNGFWSKFIIIIALVQSGRYGYAFWAVLASILTLASFMKVMKYAFFGKIKATLDHIKEVPLLMKLPMITLALVCLAGGILLIPGINEVFLRQAMNVLVEKISYSSAVFNAVR